MKTTIEISDNLLRRTKALAHRENLTLKDIVEEGLELALRAREGRKPHKVEPVVFEGQGLAPEFRGASWAQVRSAIYEGRGG